MNAEVEKDGKVRQLKPDFFDAKGKVLKVAPNIWGGTKVYISGQFNPYSSTTGVGVSLRLNALQIIELRDYEAVLNEGTQHCGQSALLGLVARKP